MTGSSSLQLLRENIFMDIDRWVEYCANSINRRPYLDAEYVPSTPGNPIYTGIQQVRDEIVQLVDVILERNLRGSILEIGLG
mgnify:CR=1 FL=1